MSTYYATLGLAMAAAGILTDVAGARTTWALAGCVYLVASLVAFTMTRRVREEAERRAGLQPVATATGVERIEALMAEIDVTKQQELEQPPKKLPYLPRRRASG
jgi:hypothetical protein